MTSIQNTACDLKKYVASIACAIRAHSSKRFFKTGLGGYAQHDQFIGISVPQARKVALLCKEMSLKEIQKVLISSMNEERLAALFMLCNAYKKGNTQVRQAIHAIYLDNIAYINNWNLVDASAPVIVGSYLYDLQDKSLLLKLAQSANIWERRIAIVATLYFIRQNSFESTIQIARLLHNDDHDLIHKAVGWMLREMGKRSIQLLKDFLDENATKMARTMLRYAIEKFSKEDRVYYLNRK
jgi:3-methyladenine DNA glycosylase AlkD